MLLVVAFASGALAQEAGWIVEAVGTVTIVRAGAEIAGVAGTAVHIGDLVRTSRPGRARLVFQDDSVLTLADATSLVVDESVVAIDEGLWTSVFTLVTGKVRMLVSEYYTEPGSAFAVKTGTAVSGVRGTQFVVAYSPRKAVTEVLGLEGSVRVHSVIDLEGPGVLVHAGELTAVAEGELPTPPRKASASSSGSLLDGLELIGDGSGSTATRESDDGAAASSAEEGPPGQVTGAGADLTDDRTTGAAVRAAGDTSGDTSGAAAGRRADQAATLAAPSFPGDDAHLTPSDLLGEPAGIVEQKGGLGVEF